MEEIKFSENVTSVKINNILFEIDCDSIENHQCASDFLERYKGNRLITENFINDCKYVIDVLLGEGSYKRLFVKDDLKPYYTILRLFEILNEKFEDQAITEKMREKQENIKQESENLKSIVKSMGQFSQQLNHVEGKYGMQAMAQQRRTPKKHKNKR